LYPEEWIEPTRMSWVIFSPAMLVIFFFFTALISSSLLQQEFEEGLSSWAFAPG
jgi:hypothetical protein